MKARKLCLYDKLVASDILTPIRNHLKSGAFILHDSGRITQNERLDFERLWVTPFPDEERNCTKWLNIYFIIYKIIPKGCRNCWKIAFHPKTLEDTFHVLEIQRELGIVSKSGPEQRGHTGARGGFSSFWYTPLSGGLSAGREIFDKVKEVLNKELGYSDGLILKRGCTEMEEFFINLFGDSRNWDKKAQVFDVTERLLDSCYDIPEHEMDTKPAQVSVYVQKMWIEWGFEHHKATGDLTYLKYTNGIPLVPPLFNYGEGEGLKVWIPSTWGGENVDSGPAIDSIV